MEKTIKISKDVKSMLDKLKMFERESYNEVIRFLLEDQLELKKNIINELNSRSKTKKTISHEEIKKKYGL